MIEQGRHSHKFFAPVYDEYGNYTYRFKSPEEFQMEQQVMIPDLGFEEQLTCLDDLLLYENPKNTVKTTKECFVDFVKGLLQMDPRKRWTASMSRQHPFISRKNYEGPFTPKVEKPPVPAQNHSIDEHDEHSDSSSVSRRNRSDDMYDKMGSCPSQILRDPPDQLFNKSNKKPISEKKRQEIFNNRSYRPPILSLDVEYFKGFNFNSLDSISEGFKDMIYNQIPEQKQSQQVKENAFTSAFKNTPSTTAQSTSNFQPSMQSWGQCNQNQMNYMPQQMQPSQNFQMNYGYSNSQNMQYSGFGQPMGVPMSGQVPPNQMYGQGYPMQQQQMMYGQQQHPQQPQQQNYGFTGGFSGFQQNVPQQPASFQNNQFYGAQDPWNQGYQENDFSGGFSNQNYGGFESMGFYNQSQDMSFYPKQDPISTQGDPHPSMFKGNNQQPKRKIKPPTEDNQQMRVGSWDPKFLAKSGIKKFHHNNGQGYKQGQPSSCQMMKKSTGYSKVKRNKKVKAKQGQNKQMYNSQNIFSQAFGGAEEIPPAQSEPPVPQNQVPFLDIQEPPKTAKFDTFNQNMPKSKKSSDNFGNISGSTFQGSAFSNTYKIDGPLKSSRMPQNEPVIQESSKAKLKKTKSNNCDEVMQDQANFFLPQNNQNMGFQGSSQMNFGVIEEENKYGGFDSVGSSFGSSGMNFVSGQIPKMEAFDLGHEGGGYADMPSHTPAARSKKPPVGTDEDRNSKGINGLLELAGTQYQMEQIGEEGE
jgi:hypothetical protein